MLRRHYLSAVDRAAVIRRVARSEDGIEAGEPVGEVDERPTCRAGAVHGHLRYQDEDLSTGRSSLVTHPHGGEGGVGDLDRAEVAGKHHGRRCRIRDADDGHLDASDVEYSVRLHAAEVLIDVRQIRRQEGEVAHRQQALQVGDAVVEVVVAQRVGIETHRVHRLDCWFVVKQVRNRRRGPEGIAGPEDQGVRVGCLLVSPARLQLGGATDSYPVHC